MAKKTKLEWRNEKRRVRDIFPCERNPNVNTPAQFARLKKSMSDSGYVEPIIIDTNGEIVAGAHRHAVMLESGMGDSEIDVRVPNRKLTKEEFDRYMVASNAVRGIWSFEKLKTIDDGILLDLLDESTKAEMWSATLRTSDDGFDVDREIAKIQKPKSKVGDLYQIGPHKLIVGDACDPAVLQRLFGSERTSLIYSDPVFNLGVKNLYSKGLGGKQNFGGNVNDTRTPEEYREFLKKSMEAALSVSEKNLHVFYYNDQSQINVVQDLYQELGLANRRVCLWVKNGGFPVPGVAFGKSYEPCIYATRGKPYLAKGIDDLNEILNPEIGNGNRTIDDILDLIDLWLVRRLPGKEYTHATAKPTRLHERPIRRCSRVGDIILDSFSGSGSTLAAAHQLKRRAYVVELEPLFADLTIRRAEALGLKAKRV